MSTAAPLIAEDLYFPESDGIPMETEWHRAQMNLLIDVTTTQHRHRRDYHVGGNNFIYYDPRDPRKNAGPDYFYVNGVRFEPLRPMWKVWEEGGRFPDLIIELMSPKTKHKDRKTNKAIYERVFRTPEYFLYDPRPQPLFGWRLTGTRYRPIEPDGRGWMWCEQLGLWLGEWEGTYRGNMHTVWIRFYDEAGNLVPTAEERAMAEAEAERRRGERRKRSAEKARRELLEERRRAEAAEAELARLRVQLEQARGKDGGRSSPRE